jgi:hypothetical protein
LEGEAKMAEHKLLGIILAVGLLVVAGIFWVLDDDEPAAEGAGAETVSVAPPDTETGALPAKPEISGEPVDAEMAGKVLISKRPVQVLSEPSPSASAMFGFPAGRPFRAISKKDGFIRIQDVRSGASGWIEEAALAPAPTAPVEAAPSSVSRSTASSGNGQSAGSKRSASSPSDTASVEPEPAPQPKRRGLFGGGGGILGGLFGGR